MVLICETCTFVSEEECRCSRGPGLKNSHKDMASHCRGVSTLHISLEQTFVFIESKPVLNKLGLLVKEIYRTVDVCKVLKITPDTFRARLRSGFYENKYKRDGIGRMFTLQDIEELKR
jgi:hypothetical protein